MSNNGHHVHPNPNLSESAWVEWRHAFTKLSADEVKQIDDKKKLVAEQNNYLLIYVWDQRKWTPEKYKEEFDKIISIIKERMTQNDN